MRYQCRLTLYEEIIFEGVGKPNVSLFPVFPIRTLRESDICHASLSDLVYCFIDGTNLTMSESATANVS